MIFEDVFKFVNLKDDTNRQQTIDMVRKMEEMKGQIEEDAETKLPFYDWLGS